MLDSVPQQSDVDSKNYVSLNEINIPYYESWANHLINLVRRSLKIYDNEGVDKSLVRYLKIQILDEKNKILDLSRSINSNEIDSHIIPDEPVAFNDDGAITIDFKSPVRISGHASGDTLTIDSSFPGYMDIINTVRDFSRVEEIVCDAVCFGEGPEDIPNELIERAKEYATQFMPNEDLLETIDNITSDFPNSINLNDFHTTPMTIAFLAYARKTALDNHKIPLSEMYMRHGEVTESPIISFINQNVRALKDNAGAEMPSLLTERIYDRYEMIFDMSFDNGMSM
ncbi:MAG TPA: hypothetical protein DG048_14855 [Pseudoalteromonas sp.]|nr:hypothetical protein [Pseudoalteromonas sp.]|tara:strand:- start:4160 stop:5011 length:852 start_codon:yes stop_codon:yes gene_type:complete